MQQLKELMSRDVKVISPDMSIGDAARKMRDGDFGMMPVGEDDRMIGTISDRDIAIRAVAEGKDAGTKVRDVMTMAACRVGALAAPTPIRSWRAASRRRRRRRG
jgi:predicted transcriptional regulator